MIRQDVRNVKRYCSEPLENIENYDKAVADTEHVWDCHHRNEICLANQSRLDRGITTREQLIADGMYFKRPACELIFLRRDVHKSLHHRGKRLTSEMKDKISRGHLNHPAQSRQVVMRRMSDGFTKVFPSQSEAARWLRENGYPKADQSTISKVCSDRGDKKRKTIYGATWRRV